jgi:anti-sigma B factor antagonist
MSETAPGTHSSSAPGFEVRVRRSEDVTIVALRGELCLLTASGVARHLDALIGEGAKDIVLDLHDVGFMDSTGVRLLIETDERAEADGFRFAISLDGNQPSRVLELVGLTDRPRRIDSSQLPPAGSRAA